MNGNVLLDTNVVIGLFRGEKVVEDKIAEADEVFIPSIVLGELYYGAAKSGREDNLERIEQFASSSAVLACGADTARHYGTIKSDLQAKGRPIPENDIWVAAIAREYGLVLVTRDNHFVDIDDLKQDRW